jgi:hypothetical protein
MNFSKSVSFPFFRSCNLTTAKARSSVLFISTFSQHNAAYLLALKHLKLSFLNHFHSSCGSSDHADH